MSYTAWETVRKINIKEYGIDAPKQPKSFTDGDSYITNLEKECLAFIREDCEELRFDKSLLDCTDTKGDSIGKKQIPYNMEKDTDRLCFERAIHKFMQTGMAEDAFGIYFCYIELFIGKYQKCKELVEMLAEFERNASSLLMKHRDHYSHSVYVFILGLAIFHNNQYFRDQYRNTYMNNAEAPANEVAAHFLKYWGLTALFHDIGYPFELPFEQVKSYFGDSIKDVPFVNYRGIEGYTRVSEKEGDHFRQIFGCDKPFNSSTELIAHSIVKRLGKLYKCKAENLQRAVIELKPTNPEAFGGFMDHAVFSGIVLYKQLVKILGVEAIDETYIDAITAITLHNSMFKFSIRNGKPLPLEAHPLAYMLMLCDELQCWDRTSYGRNSRAQLHPMWFDMSFENGVMKVVYYYDARLEARKSQCEGTYRKMSTAEGCFTKDCKFVKDIEEIIDLNTDTASEMKLELKVEFEEVTRLRKLNTYLSNSNFIHLYNFAVLVHGRRKKTANPGISFNELEDYLNELTLEYKLSVIERTKNYAKYLDAVGMFYTDKPVIYDMVTADDIEDDIEFTMGEMEHLRWNEDKLSLGWTYGTGYVKTVDGKETEDKALRERTRTHRDIVDYDELTEHAKSKDKEPLREMLPLLEQMDGIRVYRIPGMNRR
jgi:hypothetical protein